MTEHMKPRLRHYASIALIEFLRPGGYCPAPYSIEMAFQTLRCLLASGVGYKTQHYWHSTSVTSLLGGYSSDHSYPTPITSRSDLLSRFHSAILARGGSEVQKWREDKGINAYATLDLSFLHYKPMAPVPHLGFGCEADIQKALDSLFLDSAGKSTAVSLNSIHHSARVIHKVDVTVSPTGFCFKLRYGFHTPEKMREKGDSEWDFCLARTQKAAGSNSKLPEPFLDTLRRALDRYAFILNPANSHLTTTLSADDIFVPKKQEPSLA